MKKSKYICIILVSILLIVLGLILLYNSYQWAELLSKGFIIRSDDYGTTTGSSFYNEGKHASLDDSFQIAGGICLFFGFNVLWWIAKIKLKLSLQQSS